MTKEASRREAGRKPGFIALSAILILLLPLSAAEIFVRTFSHAGWFTPASLKEKSLHFKPAVFSKHVLEAREHHMVNSLGAEYRINGRGYRGPDFKVPKPGGVFRIVFYGGSSAFDIGSSEGRDWPHRVEKRLREMGFTQVEVINAGVPAQASYDSIGSLFAEGHLWEPDMAVLYTAWNDFGFLTESRPLQRVIKPYDEKADPLLNYQGLLDRFLCEISQVYVRVRYRYLMNKWKVGLEGARSREINRPALTDGGLRQFRLNVETFIDVARNAGAVPVLITEAHPFHRGNSRETDWQYWEQFQTLTLDAMYDAQEKTSAIFHEAGLRKQTAVIDAAAVMDGKTEFFRDHVHLTDAGSERLAELAAEGIARVLRDHESQRRNQPIAASLSKNSGF